jgi:hypothetical protein
MDAENNPYVINRYVLYMIEMVAKEGPRPHCWLLFGLVLVCLVVCGQAESVELVDTMMRRMITTTCS